MIPGPTGIAFPISKKELKKGHLALSINVMLHQTEVTFTQQTTKKVLVQVRSILPAHTLVCSAKRRGMCNMAEKKRATKLTEDGMKEPITLISQCVSEALVLLKTSWFQSLYTLPFVNLLPYLWPLFPFRSPLTLI